jgi:hypothetical protein
MSATLSGNASQVNGLYTSPLNKTIAGGGSTGTTLEQDPTFTFIPVSDDTIAQQLLQPIQSTHFYILFQQGWRLDQLMRLMVNRIEFTPSGTNSVHVIRNAPSSDNEADFMTFLRISALAYELQRKGHLVVAGKSHYQVIATHLDLKTVAAKDITDANAQGYIWKETDDGKYWELGKNVIEPEFKLNPPDPNSSTIPCPATFQLPDKYKASPAERLLACEISNDAEVKELASADSLIPALRIIEAGFVVTGDSGDKTQTTDSQSGSAQFVMRSLIGAMAAAAEEEDVFNEILGHKECPLTGTPPAGCQGRIPAVERYPLLTLTWKHTWSSEDEEKPLTNSLVELDYMGTTYRVADIANKDDLLLQSSWNRDMFRIISQLSSEITVDLSKFPLPTVLQLRPQ